MVLKVGTTAGTKKNSLKGLAGLPTKKASLTDPGGLGGINSGKLKEAWGADPEEVEEEEPVAAGYLQNLRGSLAHYNNRMVRPKRLPPVVGPRGKILPRFLVELEDRRGGDDRKLLAIGDANFAPIEDRDRWAGRQQCLSVAA